MERPVSNSLAEWNESLYNLYIETPDGPRRVADEIEACKSWYGNRTVCHDENVFGYEVVTSFMCLRWGSEEPPLVYETLVTGLGQERTWRYATRDEARISHERVVYLLRSGVQLVEIN